MQFRDICRRLVIPDIATGLNVYAPYVPHEEATRAGVWQFFARLAFLVTRAIALTPFLFHMAFTMWFYQASVVTHLNAYVRAIVLVMYAIFFVSAIVMCEYLRRITKNDRAAIKAKLSAET